MLEYDASLALRVEIIETALTALFDTLPSGQDARHAHVALLKEKLRDVGFAHGRRHDLERAIAHISQKL